MSSKYPGGIISKTAPVPSGAYSDSTAPGVWTLEQQAYWQKLGQWPTAGNVNPNLFIENLFSTYLYTGTGVAQTITNSIDLSGNGGAVWIKGRNAAEPHVLVDTARGAPNALRPNAADASVNDAGRVSAFTTSGFTVGTDGETNGTSKTYTSWTFREQAKFFDVVTYTGDGATNQTISHNLGSTPGCIIVKASNDVNGWYIYHRGLTTPNNYNVYLSATAAEVNQGSNVWNVTSTTFQANQPSLDSNKNGINYVAYIFAHNAGGFGLTGTDNVISCGSYTGTGAILQVTVGFEPQWLMIKRATGGTANWYIFDNMRGFVFDPSSDALLSPNLANAEVSAQVIAPTATGFQIDSGGSNYNGSGSDYIYIAIRRGPMAVPTLGTSVFSPNAYTGAGAGTNYTTNFPVDSTWVGKRNSSASHEVWDRLRGSRPYLFTDSTAAEGTFGSSQWLVDSNTKVTWSAADGFSNISPDTFVTWNFKRAPGFFDEVCYTGTGAAGLNVTHNLGVVPELMIVKCRTNTTFWYVYSATLGPTKNVYLNSTSGEAVDNTAWNDTAPTSTQFTLGNGSATNTNTDNYVNYLFATCAGVSKVGSYTGTGAAQTINCGFTGGSRFVLIKRTDSTGDWYVWDSARGIIPANDPYLLLNTTAAEVTGTDYVDTTSVGFDITSTAPAAINANGGTFIFLAIA